MSKNYKTIPNIHPGQSDWTAKVIVAEKSSPKSARNGSTRYLKMTLIDTEGNKVQATIFDPNISALEDKFILSKTYLISNATVRYTPPQFKETVGKFQWTISGTTRIQEIREDHSALLSSTYVFTPFHQVQDYMDTNTDISILGVAIDIRPKRLIQTHFGSQSYVQDVILVNDEFQIIVLTMWNGFVEREASLISDNLTKRPILVGKQLKVSSFNGLSISTKPSSSFIIDPPFEQATQLKSWVDTNVQKLNDIVAKKCYYELTSSRISVPKDDKITQIRNIEGLLLVQNYFWLRGKADIAHHDQSFWYMSCNNCNKSTYADFDEIHCCSFCKYSQARAIPRARAFIKLQDLSGCIHATMIGETAEKFLQCSALTLMKEIAEEGLPPSIVPLQNEKLFFYMKAIKQKNGEKYKYDVIFVIDESSTTTKTPHNRVDESTSLTPLAKSLHFTHDCNESSAKRELCFGSKEGGEEKDDGYKEKGIAMSESDDDEVEEADDIDEVDEATE